MIATLITKSGFTKEIDIPIPPPPIWTEVFFKTPSVSYSEEVLLENIEKKMIFYMEAPKLGIRLTYREK